MIDTLVALVLWMAALLGAPQEDDDLAAAMMSVSRYALEAYCSCDTYLVYEEWPGGLWVGAASSIPEAAGGFVLSEGRWTFEIHED